MHPTRTSRDVVVGMSRDVVVGMSRDVGKSRDGDMSGGVCNLRELIYPWGRLGTWVHLRTCIRPGT